MVVTRDGGARKTLLATWRSELAGSRSKTASMQVDLLAENPFWTINKAAQRLGVAYTRAQRAVEKLQSLGVLEQVDDAKRGRVFCAKQVGSTGRASQDRGIATQGSHPRPHMSPVSPPEGRSRTRICQEFAPGHGGAIMGKQIRFRGVCTSPGRGRSTGQTGDKIGR